MDEHIKTLIRLQAERLGYRFRTYVVDGQTEEHLVRPDGSVAVTARRPLSNEEIVIAVQAVE